MALTPDGCTLATICWDNSVPGAVLQLWDPEKGVAHYRSEVSGSGVTSAAWSPDGKTLAMGSMGTVGFLLFRDNKLKRVAGSEGVYSVAWSHSGQLLATGDERGEISIWKVGDPKVGRP